MSKIICSFCSKTQHEVKQLIAGPEPYHGVKPYICNECVEVCHKIVTDNNYKKTKELINTVTPESIKEYLDQYVVGQDLAKEVLAVAAYNHFKRINNLSEIEIQKSNILMLGPSGTGKTLLTKTISKFLDLPFAIADATSLTEAGYVGDDVENIIERLIQSADGDIEKAQKGIIFVDEIDKKIKKTAGGNSQRDVSGEGVQQALLKMVEGCVIKVNSKSSKYNDVIDFDTSNVLFVVGGAFVGIENMIKKNQRKGSAIGFSAEVGSEKEFNELIELVHPKDVIDYGLIPEFVGRFPIIVPLKELEEDDLFKILTEPKDCIINQYRVLFKMDNIELEFSEKYLKKISKECVAQKTGARGLRSLIEKALHKTQFNLPTLNKSGVVHVFIDGDGSSKYMMKSKIQTKE